MAMTSTERGITLLTLARASIAKALGLPVATVALPGWLQQPGACFVTLTQKGQLRGCIGSLQAHQSLIEDVRANAVASALRDPRFAPLKATELNHTQVEVSVLSPTESLEFSSEAQALAQLRPLVDGVVLECAGHRSTFLPQVWEQLPTVDEFMRHLKRKAGLPENFWSQEVRLQRYTVEKWKEEGLPA
jgi:AmmeMemoRadiSam system protein A